MKIKKQPWIFLVLGIVIVLIGAFAKIQHISFATILLGIGLLVEVFGLFYLIKNIRGINNGNA